MFPGSGIRVGGATRIAVLLTTLVVASACAMAGFGGSLKLNITGQETRPLAIEIDAGASDARVIEIDAAGEVELGTGRVTIDRYVLQRARLGSSAASGYFLCPKPCSDPVSAYLVAYSPEHIFDGDGRLELHFRIIAADGSSQELSRTVSAEMLPALWQTPRIEARASSR